MTPSSNLVFGVYRDVTHELDWNPRKRRVILTVSIRREGAAGVGLPPAAAPQKTGGCQVFRRLQKALTAAFAVYVLRLRCLNPDTVNKAAKTSSAWAGSGTWM